MERDGNFNERGVKNTINDQELTQSTQAFYLACKRGIYKELKRKNLITDAQLNQLLGQLE